MLAAILLLSASPNMSAIENLSASLSDPVKREKIAADDTPRPATSLLDSMSVKEIMNTRPADIDKAGRARAGLPREPRLSPLGQRQAEFKAARRGADAIAMPARDYSPDISAELEGMARDRANEAERAKHSTFDRIGAAVESNWFMRKLARAFDGSSFETDPEWQKTYAANRSNMEEGAKSDDEVTELRDTNSFEEYTAAKARQSHYRELDRIVAGTRIQWDGPITFYHILSGGLLLLVLIVAGRTRKRAAPTVTPPDNPGID